MSTVLFLHILGALVWLGCLLTEAVLERVGDGSETIRGFVSEAHWRIDLYVEIPAFVVTLLTGAHLASVVAWTAAIAIMVVAGLVAVAANIYCVYIVRRRLDAAEAHNCSDWFDLDQRQHRWGAVVFVAQLIALGAGITLFTAG